MKNPHFIPPTRFMIQKPQYAIWCSSAFGPHFGDYGIISIDTNDDAEHVGYINFGKTTYNSYVDTTGKCKSLFTNTNSPNYVNKFTVDDIEVYSVN